MFSDFILNKGRVLNVSEHEFFICPYCGNVKTFKVFTSSYRVVVQSPESSTRIDESSVVPSLNPSDNPIECQVCLKRMPYEVARHFSKMYREVTEKLSRNPAGKHNGAHTGVNS